MAVKAEAVERRMFPRIPVRAPVRYAVQGSDRQHIAVTLDFSATGLKMFCKESLAQGTRLQIEIKPDKKRTLPAVNAEGRVTRCEPSAAGFYVSCQLDRIGK